MTFLTFLCSFHRLLLSIKYVYHYYYHMQHMQRYYSSSLLESSFGGMSIASCGPRRRCLPSFASWRTALAFAPLCRFKPTARGRFKYVAAGKSCLSSSVPFLTIMLLLKYFADVAMTQSLWCNLSFVNTYLTQVLKCSVPRPYRLLTIPGVSSSGMLPTPFSIIPYTGLQCSL